MVGISVIIPVYNVEKYIAECLQSILENDFKDFEIICVNDGSKDDSLKILEEFSNKDDRIKVISQENKGQSAARNKGLSFAEGKYVYFLDSDDKITKTALGELYTKLENDKLDVLYFSGESFYENKTLETEFDILKEAYVRKHVYEGTYEGLDLFEKLRENRDYSMSPCIQIIRRELLQENNISFIEGIIHEDNHFSFMVILHAKKAACIKNTYFLRRIRESSVMTTEKTQRNLMGYFTCFYTILDYFKEHEIDSKYESAVNGLIRGLKQNVKNSYLAINVEERELFQQLLSQPLRLFFKSVILSEIEMEVKLKKTLRKIEGSIFYKAAKKIIKAFRKIKKAKN